MREPLAQQLDYNVESAGGCTAQKHQSHAERHERAARDTGEHQVVGNRKPACRQMLGADFHERRGKRGGIGGGDQKFPFELDGADDDKRDVD